MVIKYLVSSTLAVLCAAPLVSSQVAAQATQASTTLTGCVYKEKDVPGRAPNVAERAGVMEDYILAELTPPRQPVGTSGSASAPATGTMYKLEHAKDEELKAMVGKRVEVTGRIDAEAGDTTGRPPASAQTSPTDRAIGRDKIDLPEFEVTSIREVAGTCPATPSTRP
jgi:hypothetical protein